MKFPDRDKMTPKQAAANQAAAEVLIPGKHYTFLPAIKATAISVAGPQAWPSQEMTFNRGYYLGFKNDMHVFQGKPIMRPAEIPANLAESYFHVLFIGGVTCDLDPNQKPD